MAFNSQMNKTYAMNASEIDENNFKFNKGFDTGCLKTLNTDGSGTVVGLVYLL